MDDLADRLETLVTTSNLDILLQVCEVLKIGVDGEIAKIKLADLAGVHQQESFKTLRIYLLQRLVQTMKIIAVRSE